MLKSLARKPTVSASVRPFALGLALTLALAACAASPPVHVADGELQGHLDDAVSPYDRAVEAGKQRQRDDALLTRDVLEAVEALRADANAKAKATAGQVYVDEAVYQRVLVVVPLTEERAELSPVLLDISPTNRPPADAEFLEWTDSFALAHERSASYGSPRLLSIERQMTSPYFVATLEIDLLVTHRDHIEGRAAALPNAPAGFISWCHRGLGLRMRSGPSRASLGPSDGGASLRPLSPPSGELASARANENILVEEAIAALDQKPTHSSKVTIELTMGYDDESGGWKLDSEQWRNYPSVLLYLSWFMGTSAYGDVLVFDGEHLPWE